MDIQFLLEKLQQAPAGFGFADIGEWLQDVPHIQKLAEIEPLFFEVLSRKELLALVTLIKYRYIKEGPAYDLFGSSYQQYVEENGVEDFYSELSLYQDISKLLDISALQQRLTKLIISASTTIEEVVLPKTDQLEALELSDLSLLTTLNGICELQSLRYLAINKCPLLANFSFINSLNQLLWLDLSSNEQLLNLGFLTKESLVVVLQLLDTTVLDQPQTVEQLTQLKHLKYLTIAGKQVQIQALREQLPNCVINGISAVNSQIL